MNDRNLFRLGHIRDCIAKVEYLVNKLHNYDNFEEQWVEQDAIIRNLEIIGEASVNVSGDLRAQYPGVDWKEMREMREMRGMRNFVTHQYFGVSLTIIWDIVTNDIPVLKNRFRTSLQIWEETDNPNPFAVQSV